MAVLKPLFGNDADIVYDRDYQVLLLANVLPPLGTALLGPILNSLTGPFGASPAEIGLLISAFSAPPIVMIPVVGILSDRYGRKPVLLFSLILFGITGAAVAFTTDFAVALALRGLQGIGFGGIGPVIITSIGDLYDETTEATAQGVRFTTSGFALAFFPFLSGAIIFFGWQYPFLLYAMSLPVALAVYLWFDEPMEDAEQTDTAVTDGGTTKSHLGDLFDLVRQPRVTAVVVARGLPGAIWLAFNTYNSIIVVRFMQGTPTQAGILIAVASVMLALSGSQAGRITAYFNTRFYPILIANLCLGVGFGVFLFASTLWVSGVGIAVTGVGFGVTSSLYRSIITGLATADLRGGLVCLAESFGRVVATLTPVVMGAVIAAAEPRVGLETAILGASIGATLISSVGGLVCLLVARKSSPVQHRETA